MRGVRVVIELDLGDGAYGRGAGGELPTLWRAEMHFRCKDSEGGQTSGHCSRVEVKGKRWVDEAGRSGERIRRSLPLQQHSE